MVSTCFADAEVSRESPPACLSEKSHRLVSFENAARTDTYSFQRPFHSSESLLMEFRLIYQGPLQSESHKRPLPKQKHAIRKALHPQLKELWRQHRRLQENLDDLRNNWDRCGFHFLPLITKDQVQSCSLDITFLRRDHPGNLIKSGGDIDNRLKVLFDGLRMVDNVLELGGETPAEGEDPFYCLLEDDELITQVRVTTDRLLMPVDSTRDELIHEVTLIIHVKAYVEIIDNPAWYRPSPL